MSGNLGSFSNICFPKGPPVGFSVQDEIKYFSISLHRQGDKNPSLIIIIIITKKSGKRYLSHLKTSRLVTIKATKLRNVCNSSMRTGNSHPLPPCLPVSATINSL